jgi:putrescine aminotransferase
MNIRPDIMPIAKGLSSGYLPIGGVVLQDHVAEVLATRGGEFTHGYTYSGHPVACAVAKRNIEIIRDEGLVERVGEDTGPYLQQKWASLADHPIVGEVRGIGFLGALELVKHKTPIQCFDPSVNAGMLCRDICASNGLVMRAVRDTMIISPPLIMSHDEIDELVSNIWKCLDLTARSIS